MQCLVQRVTILRALPCKSWASSSVVPSQLTLWRGVASHQGSHDDPPHVRRERARQLLLKQAADEAVRPPVVEDLGYEGTISEHDIAVARQRKERNVAEIRRQAEALSDPCKIIDGKRIASEVRLEIKTRIAAITSQGFAPPGLAVVMVGNRKDSASYVKSKENACAQVGIKPTTINLPEDATEKQVLDIVDELNADENIDGVLVQLPLPKHINSERVLHAIDPKKDIDGFHPHNLGLVAQGSKDAMVPCTPKGCLELLKRRGVDLPGKFCAVIGASNIVGLPMALLLLRANATVEIIHAHTGTSGFGMGKGQAAHQADILIVCCGQPQMVTSRYLKPGGVVIDVGINVISDSSRKSGTRMVGDANFEDCLSLSSQVTPVPGGVGPMTVAMLMENVLIAYCRRHDLEI